MAFKMNGHALPGPYQKRSDRLAKRARKQRAKADEYVEDFSEKGEKKYTKHQDKYAKLKAKASTAKDKENPSKYGKRHDRLRKKSRELSSKASDVNKVSDARVDKVLNKADRKAAKARAIRIRKD